MKRMLLLLAALLSLVGCSTATATPTRRPVRTMPSMAIRLSLLALTSEWSSSRNYFTVEGQVKNVSGESLRNVVAVATVYDANRNFITYEDALIEYTTLMPNQTSPFRVIMDGNPAIKYYDVEFQFFGGEKIRTRDDR